MRTIFISDIHGNYTKFMALLKNIEYTEQDTLILGGDYFDRGKENVKMVEWLIENHNKDNIHLIRGNHDDFMIDLFKGNNEMYEFNYKNNGFNKTIKELIYPNRFYDPVRAGNLIRLRYPELPSIMNNLINHIEIDDVIYTHGSYTDEDSDEDWLEARWARSNIFAEENTFDKTIVIGHWIMGDEPMQIRNVIFCDGNFMSGKGFAYIRNGKGEIKNVKN